MGIFKKWSVLIVTVRLKKWILPIAALLCAMLSLYLSVVQFSDDNIKNIREDREPTVIPTEKMEFKGWDDTEFGLIASDERSSVLIRLEQPIYVNNLLIGGKIDRELSEISVRYTEVGSASTTVSKRLPLEVKNSDAYLSLNAAVSQVELTLSDSVGDELELEAVTLNPTGLNVNFLTMLLAFVTPMVMIWFALEWACDKSGFAKLFGSLKKYRYLLLDLVSRELKTKYRRSVLGILWSVLNPLLMMLVLTAVFSNIFRYQIEDFPVYYLTGYILFNFVSEATNFSMTSILGAAGLIKKVYIPKIIFPLEKCIFALVNLLFSLIAAVIVFMIMGVDPSWTMLLFFVPIIYLFIFNFGFGLILATLNTFFRDVGYLYGVLLTVWMYLTPIIYPASVLPSWMQSIVRVNPLYHYVEYFRAVTLYGTLPSLSDNLICIAYAVIFLLLGIGVFRKCQNKFIFYV